MIILYRYIKRRREEKENPLAESTSPSAAPKTTASSKLSQKPPCRHQAPAILQEQEPTEAQSAGFIGTESPNRESDVALKPPGQLAPNADADAQGKALDCKTEKKDRRIYRLKLIVGLLFPFALQALDVTMSVHRGSEEGGAKD